MLLPRPALLAAPLAATVLVGSLALAAPASAGDRGRTARVDVSSTTATPILQASQTATPTVTTTPVAAPSATPTARTRVRSLNALVTAVTRTSATATVTVRSGTTTTTYALAPRVRVRGLVRSAAALVPGLRVHVGGTPTATGPVADAVVVPATRANRLVLGREAARAALRKQAAERAAKARAEAARRAAEGAKKAGGRKGRR